MRLQYQTAAPALFGAALSGTTIGPPRPSGTDRPDTLSFGLRTQSTNGPLVRFGLPSSPLLVRLVREKDRFGQRRFRSVVAPGDACFDRLDVGRQQDRQSDRGRQETPRAFGASVALVSPAAPPAPVCVRLLDVDFHLFLSRGIVLSLLVRPSRPADRPPAREIRSDTSVTGFRSGARLRDRHPAGRARQDRGETRPR